MMEKQTNEKKLNFKLWKHLLLFAVVIVACMVLFTVFSSDINPIIDDTMNELGIESATISEYNYISTIKASAWTTPGSPSFNTSTSITSVKSGTNGTLTSLSSSVSNYYVGCHGTATTYNSSSGAVTVTGEAGDGWWNSTGANNTGYSLIWVDVEMTGNSLLAARNNYLLTNITITGTAPSWVIGTRGSVDCDVFLLVGSGTKTSSATSGSFDDLSVVASSSAAVSSGGSYSVSVNVDGKTNYSIVRIGFYATIVGGGGDGGVANNGKPGNTTTLTPPSNGTVTFTYAAPYIKTSVGFIDENGGVSYASSNTGYDGSTVYGTITNGKDSAYQLAFGSSLEFDAVPTVLTKNSGYNGYYFAGWVVRSTLAGDYFDSNGGDLKRKRITIESHELYDTNGSGTPHHYVAMFAKIQLQETITDLINTITYPYTQELTFDANGNVTAVAEKQFGPAIITPTYTAATGETYKVQYTYTGTTNGDNYSNTSARPTDKGTYTYKATILSNTVSGYTTALGSVEINFEIEGKAITATNHKVFSFDVKSGDPTSWTYNGYEQTPVPIKIYAYIGDNAANATRPNYVLNQNVDYSVDAKDVTYANNIVAGVNTARFNVKPMNNYTGAQGTSTDTLTGFFTIDKANIADVIQTEGLIDQIFEIYKTTYTGEAITPDVIYVTATLNGKEQIFLAGVEDGGNASRYYQYRTIYGYTDSKYDESTIVGQTGVFGGYFSLYKESDAVVYNNNINVGTASFKIVATSHNFEGEKVINFEVRARDLNSGSVTAERYYEDLVYTGVALTPDPDYIIIRDTNVRLWRLIGSQYGWTTEQAVFYILVNSQVKEDYDTPAELQPVIDSIVKVKNTDVIMEFVAGYFYYNQAYNEQGNTYTEYGNNVNVTNSATIKLVAALDNNNFSGNTTILFTINPKPFGEDVTVDNIADQIYTSELITPSVRVYDNHFGEDTVRLMALGTDYEISYGGEATNVNVTKNAYVTITGKGNYVGEIVKYFHITAKNIEDAGITGYRLENEYEYTGSQVKPDPDSITINFNGKDMVLVKGKDYSTYGGYGENVRVPYTTVNGTSVVDKVNNINYVDVEMSGVYAAGVGANFYGTIRIYFTIVPKEITLEANKFEAYANWTTYNEQMITYNGNPKDNLPIYTLNDYGGETDGNGSQKIRTVFIRDVDRKVNLNYQGEYAGTGDYYLVGWGENVNAGPTSGVITFAGQGNYTGQIDIYFEIKALDISSREDVVITLEGNQFSYTGAMITPIVNSVMFGAKYLTTADYEVSYGDGSENTNYNVLAGGIVTVSGKGNYTGSKVRKFSITPIEQTVELLDPMNCDDNLGKLFVESIATRNSGYSFVADYEINSTAYQSITVIARTTADFADGITEYPGEPRKVKINASMRMSAPAGSQGWGITSIVYTIWKEGLYSYTKAVINYVGTGIITIYAEQYDNELSKDPITGDTMEKFDGSVFVGNSNVETAYYNLGNYKNYEKKSGDSEYAIYLKYQDEAPGFAQATYTYGASDVILSPLVSSLKHNSDVVISITSSNEAVIKIAGGTNYQTRSVQILKVGTSTITLAHDGYVNKNNVSEAYMAYEKVVEYTVAKRDLIVSFEEIDVVYGETDHEFVYTYTPVRAESETSIKFDDPSTIVKYGISNKYDINTMKNVGTYQVEIYLNEDSYGEGENYDNYNLIFDVPGILNVVKKQIEIYISNTGVENQIVKAYGEANPTNYSIYNKTEFPYGESFLTLELQGYPYYVAPSIDFASGGFTALTDAGTYSIPTDMGIATNYEFVCEEVALVINPCDVIIELDVVTADYSGNRVSAAEAVVKGIEGGTVPKGTISYRYLHKGVGSWSPYEPLSAGNHQVEVTFTISADETNYKSGKSDFQGEAKIIINKVAPQITMGFTQADYTGYGIDIGSIVAKADAIPGGDEPIVRNASAYRFSPSEGADVSDYDRDDSDMTAEAPANRGFYDIEVTYIADPNDNYISCTVILRRRLEIRAGIVEITIVPYAIDFNGEQITFPTNYVSVIDKKSGITPDGTIEIQYFGKNGLPVDEQGNPVDENGNLLAPPKDAGKYMIRVIFKPVSDDYSETIKDFADAIEIRKYNLYNNMKIIFDSSDAGNVRRRVYDGQNHAFDLATEIVVTGINNTPAQLLNNSLSPQGVVSVKYVNSLGEDSSVRNAGRYNVVLTYEPGANDNYYASGSRVYNNAMDISKASVRFPNTIPVKEVEYSGNPVSLTVSKEGVSIDDIPQGRLIYSYSLYGSIEEGSSTAPSNAGVYSVFVRYEPIDNDNYQASEKTYEQVIKITARKPNIEIGTNMVFDFGYEITASDIVYTIKGASADKKGPITEYEGVSTIEVEFIYSINGVMVYSKKAPTASGTYGVKVSFKPCDIDVNYAATSATSSGCLTIKNVAPELALDTKVVYYNGSRISANTAYISNAGGVSISGRITYEYSLSGTFAWQGYAPSEVGVYDIRVNYKNTGSDSFSDVSKVFEKALEIKALEITVTPIYGQGKIYDGLPTDGTSIAYCYSYVLDGVTYYVYSTVAGLTAGEVVDVSQAYYVANDGYVYSIETGSMKAWRDFYNIKLDVVEGEFNYYNNDGQLVNAIIDYSAIGVTEGEVYYKASNGIDYVVDLDNNLAWHRAGNLNSKYNYTVQNGYYFSKVLPNGRVSVTQIVYSRIDFTDEAKGVGRYTIAYEGRNYTYIVNLSAGKIALDNEVYNIYTSVGVLEYQVAGTTSVIYIDFNNFYSLSEDETQGLYRANDGYVYDVNFISGVAMRKYPIVATKGKFDYTANDGTAKMVSFNFGDMTSIYEGNDTIGTMTFDDITFRVDVNNRMVWQPLTLQLTENDGINSFVYYENGARNEVFVNMSTISVVEGNNIGEFTTPDGNKYRIDLTTGVIRKMSHLAYVNPETNELYYTQHGVTHRETVNVKALQFTVYADGNAVYTRALFGYNYATTAPTLIVGNKWSGNLLLGAVNVGNYEIGKGNLSAGANYKTQFSALPVKYVVEKAKLIAFFTSTSNGVYDGETKTIEYEVKGLIGSDRLDVELSYDGDNMNATADHERGYRAVLTLNMANYYLVNNTSDFYRIAPAIMPEISFTPIEGGITYDGKKHYLTLGDLGDGYRVTYNGQETAPYFVAPGTYRVTALVEKANYVSREVELELTINRSLYTVKVDPIRTNLHYGDEMPNLTCNSNLGEVRFVEGQTLLPSVTTYYWIFVPYEEDFYDYYVGSEATNFMVQGTIELYVDKATPSIDVVGDLEQEISNPSALLAFIEGIDDPDKIEIYYLTATGEKLTTMPNKAGRYTVVVLFAGDENYASTEYKTVLTIKEKADFTWLWIMMATIAGLAIASSLFFMLKKRPTYDD